MAQHVLELVMQLRTGEVTSGLDKIESQINKVVENLTKFSQSVGPTTLVSPQNVVTVNEINEALKATERYTGLVNDRNVEAVVSNLRYLENALEIGDALRDQGNTIENIAAAEVRRDRLASRFQGYISSISDLYAGQASLIDDILNNSVDWQKVTEDQHKDIKEMVKHFEAIEKSGESIKDHFDVSQESFEKLKDFVSEGKENLKNSVSNANELRSIMTDLVSLVPGLAKFGMLATPVKILANELNVLNEYYEQNHTVNKLLVADLQETDNLLTGLSTTAIDAKKNGVLYTEAMQALTNTLNTGQSVVIASAEEMENLTTAIASTTRATGMEEAVLAKLSLRLRGITGDLKTGNDLMNTMVNVQKESGMTGTQMSRVASMLEKDFARLNSAYAVYNEKGELVASGSEAIVAVMGDIAKAAAEAGADVDAAMSVMQAAMEDPIKTAPLLRGAFSSESTVEQMLEMSKNAGRFIKQMDNLSPAQQQVFAQSLGFTRDQLEGIHKVGQQYEKQLAGITSATERAAKIKELEAERLREVKDEQAAQAAKAQALDTATRQMADAWDKIRIVFGQMAVAMQPILDAFAWLLNVPLVPQILAYGSVILGLIVILNKLGITLPFVGKMFKSLGKDVGTAAKQGTGKGLKAFGEGIRDFLNALGEIEVGKAAKAALTIAMVGGALAVGVGAIGLAAQLLPPDKAAQLTATLAGIVGAMYVLSLMKDVAGQALPGVMMLIAVGAGLAVGIGLIGLAANLLPQDKAIMLGIVLGGILGAMIILAIMSYVGATALPGVLMLIAVGAGLAAAVALLGLAARLLRPQDMITLGIVVGGLLIVMTLLALAGPYALLALPGIIALSALGIGLGVGLTLLGVAMNIFPINRMKELAMLIGMLMATMGLMALMGLFAPAAMLAAMALVPIAMALSASVVMLGLAARTLPADKAEILAKVMSSLAQMMVAMTAMGLAAPFALLGAITLIPIATALFYGLPMLAKAFNRLDEGLHNKAIDLVSGVAVLAKLSLLAPSVMLGASLLMAASIPLKGAIFILSKVNARQIRDIAKNVKLLSEAVSRISMRSGAALMSLAAGLISFSAAMAGGAILAFFSGGVVENAESMALALDKLISPISRITGMGSNAGDTFRNIGKGLTSMSEALSSGGIKELVTGGIIENASKLARAMKELSGPIALISRFGPDAGQTFNVLTTGVARLARVIDEGIDLDDAKELAESIRRISYPIAEILETQTEAGKTYGKALAEELHTGLAVNIRQATVEEEDKVLDKLEEIRVAIVEEAPAKQNAAIDRLAAVLDKINKQPSGKTFSNANMADTNYF